MSYTIKAKAGKTEDAFTVPKLIRRIREQHIHEIKFMILRGDATSLPANVGAPIHLSSTHNIVRAVGLTSCASICYENGNGKGYVYHANVGTVAQKAFDDAMDEIGAPPYRDVFIAVAHPEHTGPGYAETIANFITWGIPTDNIVEITDLQIDSFGVNNAFQIGY